MKKSPWGMRFYKSRINLIIMLCMTFALTGCSVQDVLSLNGDELFERIESEGVLETRTLSLEEIESKAVEIVASNASVSANDTVSANEAADYVCSVSMGDCLLYESGTAYAKKKLTEAEQVWYQDMEQILGNLREKVKLSEAGLKAGLDETDVDRIFQCVLDDHPELFYVEGYSYTKYTRGNRTVAIEFTGTYNQDKETIYARKQEIEDAVTEVLKAAGQLEDDYEKIKYVYEFLIENTEYDLESEDNQNIYSVFANQASVCQGYAKAFQYLMNRLNVECALVQGKVASTGEGHAWNLVRSAGAYYYVDPTWGDISYESNQDESNQDDRSGQSSQSVSDNGQTDEKRLPGVSYDYLCITTEQLLKTHQPTDQEALPECKALRDNYYVREDAFFTEYNEEQLAELVERRLAEGNSDIALRCSSEDCYKEMCEALLDRQEMFTYLAGSGIRSFVYSSNDSQLTLTFFMMTSQE